MKQSISQILAIHSKVLDTRETIKRLFKEYDVSVTIGGSYALKFHYPEFADREIHDYDFIIRGNAEALNKIKAMLIYLKRLGTVSKGYSGSESYHMGMLEGLPVDIILQEGNKKTSCTKFESVEDILKAKKGYMEVYHKKGKVPRKKDVEDSALITNILNSHK